MARDGKDRDGKAQGDALAAGTLAAGRVFRFYHAWVSPGLHAISSVPGGCRFVPTCSEYAATAIEMHGWIRGSGLAAWRLLRCHPFSRGGFDPVPGVRGHRDDCHHLS